MKKNGWFLFTAILSLILLLSTNIFATKNKSDTPPREDRKESCLVKLPKVKSERKLKSPAPAKSKMSTVDDGQNSGKTFNDMELTQQITNLQKRVSLLEKSLTYLLPSPVISEEDYILKAFRDRVQSHLTGYFGGYKVLSSNLLQRSEPKVFIGITIGSQFLSCIEPAAAAAAISAAIEIAKIVYEEHQEKKDSLNYHIFSSFAAIDKASYHIAEGISWIYSPQIKKLSYKGAIDLADSAGETLKWYVENRPKQKENTNNNNNNIITNKIIEPDELVLALGKYYKPVGTITKFSKNPHEYCKKIEKADLTKPHWCDMDIFLASGIENKKTGILHARSGNTPYIYQKKILDPTDSHFVYISAPTKAQHYEYRLGNTNYIAQMNTHVGEPGWNTVLVPSPSPSPSPSQQGTSLGNVKDNKHEEK